MANIIRNDAGAITTDTANVESSEAAEIGFSGVNEFDTDLFPEITGERTVEKGLIEARTRANNAYSVAFLTDLKSITKSPQFLDTFSMSGASGNTDFTFAFNQETPLPSDAKFIGCVIRLITPFQNQGNTAISFSVGTFLPGEEEFFAAVVDAKVAQPIPTPGTPGPLAFPMCPIDGRVPAIIFHSDDDLGEIIDGQLGVDIYYAKIG